MSQPINDGGPAFPLSSQPLDAQGNPMACNHTEWGMRLRDWFAAKALANIGGEYTAWGDITPQAKQHAMVIAEHAYNIADAMLAARLTKPE